MIGRAFFALVFSLSLLSPLFAHAASLSISPKSGTYEVGDRVTVKVLVQGDAPLNAVSGVVSFPSGLFSIESVSKSGSILNFWVTEPVFSSGSGTVQFEGVSLSGFQGGTGTVVAVTLRALKVGVGTVTFQSGQVLANDGQGTDITSGLHGASFVVEAAKEKPAPKAPQSQVKPADIAPPPQDVTPEDVPVQMVKTAPAIRLGLKDKYPAVYGTSDHAGADVVLTFVPLSGARLYITGTADARGTFILPVPTALRDGPYAVTASMVLPDKSQTEPSLPLTVNVRGILAGTVTYETATYASLAALFCLLPVFFYVVWRRLGPRRYMHRELNKEIREAERTLHKSFVLIREDLYKHSKRAGSQGGKAGRSVDDISDVEESLDDAEALLEKEIRDIAMVDIDDDK